MLAQSIRCSTSWLEGFSDGLSLDVLFVHNYFFIIFFIRTIPTYDQVRKEMVDYYITSLFMRTKILVLLRLESNALILAVWKIWWKQGIQYLNLKSPNIWYSKQRLAKSEVGLQVYAQVMEPSLLRPYDLKSERPGMPQAKLQQKMQESFHTLISLVLLDMKI